MEASELFDRYDRVLNQSSKNVVSVVLGQVVGYMRISGMSPDEIGATFKSLAEYQAKLEETPEIVRAQQAADQLLARGQDELDLLREEHESEQ